jgi:hypothetical protein
MLHRPAREDQSEDQPERRPSMSTDTDQADDDTDYRDEEWEQRF